MLAILLISLAIAIIVGSSDASFIPICTEVITEGVSIGVIPYYNGAEGQNSQHPIRWLKGLSGELEGPGMSVPGLGTAYVYNDTNDVSSREYLIHRTDGFKDIDVNVDPGERLVHGQKYVHVRTDIRVVTGTVYICALSAKTYYTNSTPFDDATAVAQFDDNTSTSYYDSTIKLYEDGNLTTTGDGDYGYGITNAQSVLHGTTVPSSYPTSIPSSSTPSSAPSVFPSSSFPSSSEPSSTPSSSAPSSSSPTSSSPSSSSPTSSVPTRLIDM